MTQSSSVTKQNRSIHTFIRLILIFLVACLLLLGAGLSYGDTHTVLPSAGLSGLIFPDTPQLVDTSSYITFKVSPAPGFTFSVEGTCDGDLYDNTYVTDPITADCTVEASFSVSPDTVIHYVAPGGTGDGTINSPQDLQSALDEARTNGQDDFLYLAQGTYDAGTGGADTFVYDSTANDNQAVTLTAGWDSAYTVQSEDPSLTVLDGGGTAPVLHLIADQTGISFDFTINNLSIQNGKAVASNGAGIRAYTGTSETSGSLNLFVRDSILQENNATTSFAGGALYSNCYFEMHDTVFTNNVAGSGGALYIAIPPGGDTSSETIIDGCAFDGNNNMGGWQGSTIYNPLSLSITETSLTGGYGPGSPIYCHTGSNLTLSNSIIHENTIQNYGSAIHFWSSDGTIINTLFYDNVAESGYAAVTYYRNLALSNTHTVTILNSVFAGNRDASSGTAAIHNRGALFNITNSIFWDNEGAGIYNHPSFSGTATISNSIVQSGMYGGFIDGGNNLTGDPLFVNTIGLSDTWDLRLTSSSPAIDSGDNTVDGLPVIDLDFKKRIFDGDGNGSDIVDMGAYEYESTLLYTLSAYVVGGNGTLFPPPGIYFEGTEVDLTAIPNSGYRVGEWSGTDDDSVSTAANTVTMDNDKTVSVRFEDIPNGQWVADYGDTDGSDGSDHAYEAVFDLNGQVIAGGQIFIGNGTSSSGMDAYGVKYDPAGNMMNSGWPVVYDNNLSYNQERFFGASVDSNNNILFSGLQTIGTNPQNQFTVWKYNENGEMLWMNTYHEDAWNGANEVCVDSRDNVFAAGYVFTGWSGQYYDWHIQKWDSGGTELKKFNYDAGNSEYDQKDFAYAINCDSDDNILIGGQIGISGTEPVDTDHDWHVRKYPNDLDDDDVTAGEQPIWEYTFRPSTFPGSGARNDVAIDVSSDSNNDVYVGGYINQGSDNSTNADYRGLIIKLTKDGDGEGAATPVGSPVVFAEGSGSAVYSIGINDQDRLFIGGYKKVDDSARWYLGIYDTDLTLLNSMEWTDIAGVILGVNTQGSKIVLSGYFDNRADGAPDPDYDWKVMVLDMAGDINGDTLIDLKDAIIVLDILTGGQPTGTIDSSNSLGAEPKIGARDAVHILRDVAGMP